MFLLCCYFARHDHLEETTDIQEDKTDIQEETIDIQEETTDTQETKTDIQGEQTDIQEDKTDTQDPSTSLGVIVMHECFPQRNMIFPQHAVTHRSQIRPYLRYAHEGKFGTSGKHICLSSMQTFEANTYLWGTERY